MSEANARGGSRPTVDDGPRMVETHGLDFDGDLYRTMLSTDLLERLRPDERFDSLEALVAQMDIDTSQARAMLARESVPLRAQAASAGRK